MSQQQIDKYYFRGDEYGNCTEPCQVFGGNRMIGSVRCQECQFCTAKDSPCKFTGYIDWIACEKIDQATGKDNNNK